MNRDSSEEDLEAFCHNCRDATKAEAMRREAV
jgi:hypothetical protein